MDESKATENDGETLDLSRRGLKKIEKASPESAKTVINLVLDQNELQRLDNIDCYSRVENVSICNNCLLRMHGVSRLTNLRELALNNNGILQIEGMKDLIHLRVLKLSGNNIKSIEHLNNNIHLEHLDLSSNQISFIADISYLRSLKHLNLERNRVIDLRQCDRYLPPNLEHLGLAHNNIQDLNEVCHLVHLGKLDAFTIQGNPCVGIAGKDKLAFDYRPFVLNWILSVKSIDSLGVSAIESLKAEWLYSQGRGRHYQSGQHRELCDYLASTCPLTLDATETEDQRKLRLILSKAQLHQQQLKETPVRSKVNSPRMQARITSRHLGRSPDRLTSSFHAALPKTGSPSMTGSITGELSNIMSQSFDSPGLFSERKEKDQQQQPQTPKPSHQCLEAASKMVPVLESLMSPDYQPAEYEQLMQRHIKTNSLSSQSSNSSLQEEKRPTRIGSPKLTKSATSSPKLKPKVESRKNSLTTSIHKTPEFPKKLNGITNSETRKDQQDNNSIDKLDKDKSDTEKSEIIKLLSKQRKPKQLNTESTAAVTIQKMWRGYRSRNLNKDTLRILHAIQAARSRQHIQRLTCDMEATKAALDSERKIQQLQMQAINALWKKVSSLQTEKKGDGDDDLLRRLSETCITLQSQVESLQGSMQEVLKAVSNKSQAEPVATQTDIVAVMTPQEERCSWLKRPQTLPLEVSTAPNPVPNPQIDQHTKLPHSIENHSKILRSTETKITYATEKVPCPTESNLKKPDSAEKTLHPTESNFKTQETAEKILHPTELNLKIQQSAEKTLHLTEPNLKNQNPTEKISHPTESNLKNPVEASSHPSKIPLPSFAHQIPVHHSVIHQEVTTPALESKSFEELLSATPKNLDVLKPEHTEIIQVNEAKETKTLQDNEERDKLW